MLDFSHLGAESMGMLVASLANGGGSEAPSLRSQLSASKLAEGSEMAL
jgi:hypothetical protein